MAFDEIRMLDRGIAQGAALLRLLRRTVEHQAGHALDDRLRAARQCHQRMGVLGGYGGQMGRWDNPVDQPQRLGFFRAHQAGGVEQILGPGRSHQIHQPPDVAQTVAQPESGRGDPEAGVNSREPQVAGYRQGAATADAIAGDSGNGRFAQALQPADRVLHQLVVVVRRLAIGEHLCELGDIGPGRERRPFAANHHDP